MSLAGVAALLVLAPAGSASARTDSFTGICQFVGTANTVPVETGVQEGRFTLHADGTCNGQLNGEAVSNTPTKARGSATGLVLSSDQAGVPLLFTGKGSATFLTQGANIGFSFQQIGPGVLLLEGNDGGGAIGFADALTPEQPSQPNKTNFRATILGSIQG